jgi:hypothetical protein
MIEAGERDEFSSRAGGVSAQSLGWDETDWEISRNYFWNLTVEAADHLINGLHDRPVYQEEHAAQLIMARRVCSLHKG